MAAMDDNIESTFQMYAISDNGEPILDVVMISMHLLELRYSIGGGFSEGKKC